MNRCRRARAGFLQSWPGPQGMESATDSEPWRRSRWSAPRREPIPLPAALASLASFNALTYEDQSLGGSLRQAKNFLLAYSLLKEKASRRGGHARPARTSAPAWAFTLWGDPTLKLPRPERTGQRALPHIQAETTGNYITIKLPDATRMTRW